MSSNCNNTVASNLCQTCATPNVSSGCDVGCLDIYTTSCIKYDGNDLLCVNVPNGSFLNDALCSINNLICTIQDTAGLVKINDADPHPDTLANKIVAGANIVITGIGTGDSQQLRIDAVLGGQIVDQYVKISSIDQAAGFLGDKLIGGQCVSLQKVNPGLNEKLQVVLDWNCILTQLSTLPGFCTLVNNCIPNVPTVTCPYILLNNPNINGSSVTYTWVSSGTSFTVYVDGVIQPNMPTSSLTYTSNNLSNGSHTVEVLATCNSGTPQRDNQTFSINTSCPVPNQVNVTLNGGNASLTWSLDSNSNNGLQTIQHKLASVSNWTTDTTVSSGTTTAGISGLNPNRLYNFQILNNCSVGGPSASTTVNAIQFTCPIVNLSSTSSDITYSFVGVGGDVDTYVVTLFDSSNNVVQTKSENSPFASTITNMFSGLTPSTSYQVQVVVKATSYSRICNTQVITTSSVPICPTVSNLTVTLS